MNLSKRLGNLAGLLYGTLLWSRSLLPRQRSRTFTTFDSPQSGIGPIFVINLERQSQRWARVTRELAGVLDAEGRPLSERAVRYIACDARSGHRQIETSEVEPFYTLADQLFVEPQPLAMPDSFDLARPIRMSQAEVAIARSHLGVWKAIAESSSPHALVLEDDVWIERRFARTLDRAWREMQQPDGGAPEFDILYVSYVEVRYGAPKELISKTLFRPERGLWHLSGYVLSKRGAQALLELLPIRGPVDLWMNHKFRQLDVRALRRSAISQRRDTPSTNTHSILPALTQIGILDYESTARFHRLPTEGPVFAFGADESGLSALAMALSMLGYRCCSDLDQLPECEFASLMARRRPVFNAYVNVGSLEPHLEALALRYPGAKFIFLGRERTKGQAEVVFEAPIGADAICLRGDDTQSWLALCNFLKLGPPPDEYPLVQDIGKRGRIAVSREQFRPRTKKLAHDQSPWIVERDRHWTGILTNSSRPRSSMGSRVVVADGLGDVDPSRWELRNDTFPGNLGLFRPGNVVVQSSGGLTLGVAREALGVRTLSAAAISSRDRYLHGRFEASMTATNVPGLVTGFFLHRDSPRQEIDIEIAGNRPNHFIANVFYNPGVEGARFDYGYRGTPVLVPLGFDASKRPHTFAIEWDACEIRWFVDGELLHRRVSWDPTPVPDLPMTLHVNTWPTRSREFAGRLSPRSLPASSTVHRIAIDAFGEPPSRHAPTHR